MLRAAAVGGGAYYAGKRNADTRQREASQEQRLADLEQQSSAAPPAAPAPAAGISADVLAQLKQLGELHDQGILTDEEFAQQKQRCLAAS